jgi:hypothetical protein
MYGAVPILDAEWVVKTEYSVRCSVQQRTDGIDWTNLQDNTRRSGFFVMVKSG